MRRRLDISALEARRTRREFEESHAAALALAAANAPRDPLATERQYAQQQLKLERGMTTEALAWMKVLRTGIRKDYSQNSLAGCMRVCVHHANVRGEPPREPSTHARCLIIILVYLVYLPALESDDFEVSLMSNFLDPNSLLSVFTQRMPDPREYAEDFDHIAYDFVPLQYQLEQTVREDRMRAVECAMMLVTLARAREPAVTQSHLSLVCVLVRVCSRPRTAPLPSPFLCRLLLLPLSLLSHHHHRRC